MKGETLWPSHNSCACLNSYAKQRGVARLNESDYYPMLREIYHQALVAAFDLSRMVDGMQEDLESGKTLELPKERFNEDDVPF